MVASVGDGKVLWSGHLTLMFDVLPAPIPEVLVSPQLTNAKAISATMITSTTTATTIITTRLELVSRVVDAVMQNLHDAN